MLNGILLALAAAFTYGFLGVSFEIAAKRRFKIWDFIFYKQLAGFLIGLALSFYLGLPLIRLDMLLLGCIGAVSYILTCASYLVASRERDIAANWTIVNLSVLLPLLVSIFWFNDTFTMAKAAGVAATLASIILVGGGFRGITGSRHSSQWFRFILFAFLLNGVLAVLFRWVPDGFSALFTTYFYGISCLIAVPFKLMYSRNWQPTKSLLSVSMMGATSHLLGMMLTMGALAAVGQISQQAGVIVYPITNGLVIPIGVVLGVLILKQKIDTRSRWGVAAGMTGLILLFVS